MSLMAPPRKPGRPKDPNSKRSLGQNRKSDKPRITLVLEQEQAAVIDRFVAGFRPRTDRAAVLRDALFEYFEKRNVAFPLYDAPEDQPATPDQK